MHATRVRLAVLLALYGAAGLPPRAAHATAPIVIPREAIERSGLVSLAEFLAELPIAGSTVGRRYNFGNDGAELVDLRELGPQRTLVRIDGRRAIQDLNGRADLSTIPLAAVERIEIHPAGDAARFGADAAAGVVDVVLRRGIEGAEARSHVGAYAAGDGRTQAHDVALGAATAQGSVLVVAAYERFEPVFAGDRAVSAVSTFGFPGNDTRVGASSTTPFGRFGFGFNGNTLPGGGAGTVTLIPGRSGRVAADFRPFDAASDGYNFAPEDYLETPSERTQLYARARYALGDAVELHASVLAGERRSEQRFAPLPLTLGTVAFSNLTRFAIPAGALYNPFGRDVTRAQFRPAVEPRRFTQDVDGVRYAAALSGELSVFDRPWAWSVGGLYADREQRDASYGLFDLARVRAALEPSFRDANGVARCGTVAAPIANCVPLDLFGGPAGFTREMYDSVAYVGHDAFHRRQIAWDATLAGALFELPAGPVDAAAGYARRRESGFEIHDALVAAGNTPAFVRPTLRGAFEVEEAWIDFNVPLLRDAPYARALAIDVAIRRDDYDTFGATTNASYGFRWQPFESLLLHGTVADTYRAPSIAELFTGESTVFPTAFDPCDLSALRPPDVVQRCATGFGGTTPYTAEYTSGSQFAARIGGNPDLEPELGRSRTLGLRYLGPGSGLDVHLEWSRLEVTHLIQRAGAQFVLDDCYVRANADSCRYVVRPIGLDPDGTFAGQINFPRTLTQEAWTLDLRRTFALGGWDFAANWRTAWLAEHSDRFEFDRGGDLPSSDDVRGVALGRGDEHPRLVSRLALDAERGDFGATLGLRHRSSLEEDCFLPVFFSRGDLCSDPEGTPRFPDGANRLGSATYVDLSARWNAPWQAELALGVRNALDRDPPVAHSGVEHGVLPGHDLPGRFWFASYTQRF